MPMPEPTEAEHAAARAEQTRRVTRQQLAGFAAAGLLVLAFSLWRAGWRSVFAVGWWRW
jgi:hypothetical protein